MLLVLMAAFATSACNDKNDSAQEPPPGTPSNPQTPEYKIYSCTVPGTNGSQTIQVIYDINQPPIDPDLMVKRIGSFPSKHLAGLSTVHYSTIIDEVAMNVYPGLNSAQMDEWQVIAAGKESPKDEFRAFYAKWFTSKPDALLSQFLSALRSGASQFASEYLYMAGLFADPLKQMIIAYAGLFSDGTPTFTRTNYLYYSFTGNIFKLAGISFRMQIVSGRLSIVDIDGAPVVPLAVPNMFIEQVLLAPVSASSVSSTPPSAPGGASLAPDRQEAASTAIVSPTAARSVYVSPRRPNEYRSTLDTGARQEILREIDNLTSDPSYILDHAPGTIPHGFSIDSRQAK